MSKEEKITNSDEENLTEDEKIQKLLKENADIMEGTFMDVCHSTRGQWFFYTYEKESGLYGCFYEFKTADELMRLMISQIDLYLSLVIEELDDQHEMYLDGFENLLHLVSRPTDLRESWYHVKKFLDNRL